MKNYFRVIFIRTSIFQRYYKRFLSITRLHRPLPLSHFCSYFSNLKSLHLYHAHPSLDLFIRELSQSDHPLQSLYLSHQSHFPGEAMRLLGGSSMCKTLKTLSCTYFDCLTDDNLYVVADCLSYLQRLDPCYYKFGGLQQSITDRGICAISVRLTSLFIHDYLRQ